VKKALVLVGGGRAHVEVLRQLAVKPLTDIDIALFDPSPSVWQSGMLPGVIAGHYAANDAKVNLWALCQRARVRFFEAPILAVNGENQRIESGFGERHRFDILSLDIGGVTKALPTAPGAYVVSTRPIEPLLSAITEFESVRSAALIVRVIGGGATAVEIALALAWRWRDAKNRRVSIVCDALLLSEFPPAARRLALRACQRHGVTVRENSPVRQIDPTRLRLENGNLIDTQLTILATGYSPRPLLEKSVLTKTDEGCVAVDAQLQCLRLPGVFAAGDCADIAGLKVPKASVFTDRQGALLAANLLAALQGHPLLSYQHSPRALRFLTLGDRRALVTRGNLVLAGGWAWNMKDARERKWLRRYSFE